MALMSFATQEKVKKIAIGAGIAAVGAVLTFLAEALADVDFGVWTPFVSAGLSVAANAVRKLTL